MRRHLVPLIAASFLLLTAPLLAQPQCSELHPERVGNPDGQRIHVVSETAGARIDAGAIEEAVAMWAKTCHDNVPSFGEDGNIVMRLRFHDGPNDVPGCGDGCACTISNTQSVEGGGKYLSSAITHLFERHRDGSGFCRWHRAETIAHEIGHVLGFRHPDDPYAPECRGLIMSFSPNRSVTPDDCTALAAVWQPPFLAVPPPPARIEAEGELRAPEEE